MVTLKGCPVFIMRRGIYPNREELNQICADYAKTHLIRTERVSGNRFAITAQPRS